MRKRGLGRGLSELIPGSTMAQTRAVIEVEPSRLSPNPFQPRQGYDAERLSELAESIRSHGILQPILVRPAGDGYEIVLGERRWRAAEELGVQTVPCIVQEVDDRQALELALIENLHREDLNCIETARAYRQLVEEFGFTHEELSEGIGKSRTAITNSLRLLQLPEEVQTRLMGGRLSEGHGRALLGLVDRPGELVKTWQVVEGEGLSVRETEELVRKAVARGDAGAKPVRREREAALDSHLRAVAEHLQGALATEVSIRPKGRDRGTIIIGYGGKEELERIVQEIAPGEYW